jgi:uncharacterized SAM-binding protein YcdF (DUF218 family)
MFTFKKIVGLLCQPGSLVILLAALGLLARAWRRTRLAGVLWSFAAGFAWLISTPLVGGWLLVPLERQYPPLAESTASGGSPYVVVLGSSYFPHDGIPVSAAIDDSGLKRLVEGVRLQRLAPGSKLVVSGGPVGGGAAPAVGNALLAESLGVSHDSVVMLVRPLDTRSEAAEVCRLTGSQPFFLVTSASHMPRAMEYMRRAGGRPIAAPTGYRTGSPGFQMTSLLPDAQGLRMSEDAFHEYLGWLALLSDAG